MKRYIIIGLLTILIIASLFSTSLWSESKNDRFKSLYSDSKAYKVGDILTILIQESVSMSQNDSSDDKKKGLISSAVSFFGSIGNVALDNFIPLGGNEDEKQVTDNTAQSDVTAKIAAMVTDVDENGNLIIEGRKQTKVGQDSRELLIQGIVRPNDISAQNTVDSFNIADAKIWYNGNVVFEQDPSEQSWAGYILSGISGVIF